MAFKHQRRQRQGRGYLLKPDYFTTVIDIRDFTQRRRKGLTTAFLTESNWDDDLVLSTVKLRYVTIGNLSNHDDDSNKNVTNLHI